MAVTSPSISGITVSTSNTTTRFATASFSGGVSGRYYIAQVFRAGGGGIPIASASRTGAGTMSIAYTDTNILTRLEGASSFGWQVTISEWHTYENYLNGFVPVASSTSSVAGITLSLRHTAVSHTNSPCNLDGDARMNISWTNPSSHSGWRTRLQFVIDGSVIITYSGYATTGSTQSISFTFDAGEILLLQNAMAGTSPKTMTIRCITGFALSSNSYFSGHISSSQTNNLIKLFNTVKIWLGSSHISKPIKVCLSGSTFTGKPAKAWTGSAWKNAK